MAIGWLSVLKMVPWGDVIENAPKVAQGAKKLWNSVGKKPPVAGPTTPPALHRQTPSLAELQAQVVELQLAIADLHQQMLDSSALIQSLAEQNTQLIQRVDVSRKRVLVLTVLTLGWGVVSVMLYFR